MKKDTTDRREAARVCWENLEGWVLQRVQGYIQDLFEEGGHLFPRRRPGSTTATRPTPFRAAVRTARHRWRSGPPTVYWTAPRDGHP